jgi:hydroxyethylthiazole kinase-like uncharacterized protein yjeF
MIVLTPTQMRDADARACGLTGEVALMRAAGERIADVCARYVRGTRIAAFAGPGNNGGDAFAALALLPSYDCRIFAQPAPKPSAARLDAQKRARDAGVRELPFPASLDEARHAANDADLILVGLTGTGTRFPLPAAFTRIITAVNESPTAAIAIDIPAGLDGESGAVVEPALRPVATVTLGALKSGLLLAADRKYTGDLWLADIGMSPQMLAAAGGTFAALDGEELLALLPKRKAGADKRSAGAPLVVAGSQQFPGAAVLCAMGAARAGAGYVTVAAPAGAAAVLRAHLIEQVVVTLDERASPQSVLDELLDISKRASSIAIGPGLGLDDRTGEIVMGLVTGSDLPIVADASALFHFAKKLELLRGRKIVVTPHEGEFARLSGKGTIAPGERVARLREFVDRTGITALLKGQTTLIYDGTTVHINTSGTSALATAGTGDVLTGIIATLLSQGLSPVDAACAGAYWHGLAARHAASLRPRGVIARDVYESLAAALPEPALRAEPLVRVL